MSTDNAVVTQSAPSDTTLIAAASRGEASAFQTLMSRHMDAGARLARRLAPAAPSDLLADAVATVDAGLRSGTGPRTAFRAHLLTAVRRANVDRGKGSGRAWTEQSLSRMLAESSIDRDLLARAARAYRALPENQQVALWHTEVDGEPLLDTGALLEVSGTEVAELAFTAREALRRALLDTDLEEAAGQCRWTADRLSAHVRSRLDAPNKEKVEAHLAECAECRAMLPGVRAVETELKALVALIVLGAAAGPYLGRGVAKAGGSRGLGSTAKLSHGPGYLKTHRRTVTFVSVGSVLIAAGLITGLRTSGSEESSTASADESAAISAGATAPKTGTTTDVETVIASVPDADGSGSGHDSPATPTVPITTGDAPIPVARPLLTSPVQTSKTSATPDAGKAKSDSPKAAGAAPTKQAPASDTHTQTPGEPPSQTQPQTPPAQSQPRKIHLGVADVTYTSDGGLLGVPGLPGLSLDPPSPTH
jgi:DNA-directed RNA polymerase specialized sigma24 family protein